MIQTTNQISSSLGMMTFPIFWKNETCSKPPPLVFMFKMSCSTLEQYVFFCFEEPKMRSFMFSGKPGQFLGGASEFDPVLLWMTCSYS